MELKLIEVKNTELESLLLERKISADIDLTPKRDVANTIVDILEDQHQHSVAEIALQVNLEVGKVGSFLEFLANYSFITYDRQSTTAVICPDFAALS
jgi:predicted transcriptional regulator